MSPGIELTKVGFQFQPAIKVLEDINVTFRPNEFVGIIGANGSGKTTLARLLNGNLLPDSGTVLVDGLLSSQTHHQLLIKNLVALITSDPENQFVTPTVFDEITFALQAFGLDENEIIQRSEAALDSFDLRMFRDRHPFYLSVGEQFRVLIAVAMVRKPHYLILDEISSMMDSHTRQRIWQILLGQRIKSGLGIIMLTHRLEDLLGADRIIVLQNGRIKMDDTVPSAFSHALKSTEWQVEIPKVYQVYRLLSPEYQQYFSELRPGIPEMLLNWP